MLKKESYRQNLPHFQQPGQAYFVTWCLKESIPEKTVQIYFRELTYLKNQLDIVKRESLDAMRILELEAARQKLIQKYFLAFENRLHADRAHPVNLSFDENLHIMVEAFRYWEGKRLTNVAWCVMPNHIHWVLALNERDERGEPVYLQDILQSVKRTTARRINERYGRTGTSLWQKESYETTIRDDAHFVRAVHYTLQNPVKAGLVGAVNDWPGSWNNPAF